MSAGHTVVTNFLLLILSICTLAHQPTQEVQRYRDSSQNKLLTPNLTLDEDKQCGEKNRKGVERAYRQCQVSQYKRWKERVEVQGPELLPMSTCWLATALVEECGKVWAVCHTKEEMERMREMQVEALMRRLGSESQHCQLFHKYITKPAVMKERCSAKRWKSAQERFEDCSHALVLSSLPPLTHLPYPAPLANQLCLALKKVPEQCRHHLTPCLTRRDVELVMVAHVAELRRFVETKIGELVSKPTMSPHTDLSPLSCSEEGGNGVGKVEDYYEPGNSRRWERMEAELNPDVEEESLNMDTRTKNSFNGNITVEMEHSEGEGSERDMQEKGFKENISLSGQHFTAIMTTPTPTTTSTAIPTTTTVAMEETEAIAKRLTTDLATTMIPRKMARKKVENLNEIIEDNGLLTKLLPETISTVNLTRQMAEEKMIEGKTNLPTRSRLNNSASLQMADDTSFVLLPIIFFSGLIVH